jgi:hypothetical protein
MLITRFNRMIRSRVLWGIFAGVVVISFVGVFSPGFNRMLSASRKEGVATLYGKPVSQREFALSRFFTLGMREPRGGASEDFQAKVTKRAWERLAALRTAENLGIRTSDREVAERIRRDPTFAVNGAFSGQRYNEVIRSQFRIQDGVPLFEEYVRQDLTLSKMVDTLQSAVWVAPAELSERLRSLTDEFTVQCVFLKAETNAPVTLTNGEARAFFASNEKLFAEPDKVRVRYVAVPVSNFLARVEVSDAELQERYADVQEDYGFTNKDGVLEYRTLDEVRTNLIRELTDQKARDEARDEANRFAVALAPDRAGHAPSFEEVASQFTLPVRTTAFFSASQPVPGIEVGPDFNRAAFRLDASDPEGYFSDGITGSNAVFVLAAQDKKEAHVPSFDECAEHAASLALENRRKTAFRDKAAKLRDALDAKVVAGKPFTNAVVEAGMNISTSFTFTAYSAAAEELYHADVLLSEVITMEPGETSKPLDVEDGIVLAHVAERRPVEFAAFGLPRGQVLSALNRYRAELSFRDWERSMLKEAGFQEADRTAPGQPQRPVDVDYDF